MTDAGKTIIFFSLHYPFHFTDSYLDEELNLLAAKFNKLIIVSSNTFTKESRPTPANSIVYRFTPVATGKTRLQALSLLIKPFFYQELFNLFFLYKTVPGPAVIKELFAFYGRVLATKEKLRSIISEQQVDESQLLIYTYWMVESTMAAVMQKQQRPAIRVVARAHSQDVYFERNPVGFHPYRRFIFNGLNLLFFISDNARQYFIRKHAITSNDAYAKISINRIGINSDNRHYAPASGKEVLRIVSVAYIQKLKRIDLIIDALALMQNMKIEWVHVGHSNQSESDFEKMKAYAATRLGAMRNVSVTFTGKTPKDALFRLYEEKRFDVFLNVSETEGIPVSMMEAMSYSVPVIGTNVGGVSEIVEHGLNGYLLSAYPTAGEVKEALERFSLLPDAEKDKLRINAFNTWQTKYNATKNYNELVYQVADLMNEDSNQR
jgi:glycosyltransferase involved in cell wall biosynthesis